MAVVAILAVPRLIVRHAKQPASNVLLRPARGQVPVQGKKSVLNHVLRFIARKSEAYQVSKQWFAQFAIQGRSLTSACRQARERHGQGCSIAAHEVLVIELLCK